MPKVASMTEIASGSVVVCQIISGITVQSSASNAKSRAVTFRVIPKFTRLYNKAIRKANEAIIAIVGSTSPKFSAPFFGFEKN